LQFKIFNKSESKTVKMNTKNTMVRQTRVMNHVNINAVTVNHNTSLFAELMLRSLLRCHGTGLSVTVLDNASSDAHDMASLSAFAAARGIPILQSGFDTVQRHINTHGEVLRQFVLSHPDCSHYLFLDPDVYFMDESTIDVMLSELESDESAFAIMPRCTWDGKNDHSLATGNALTGKRCLMRYSMCWSEGAEVPTAECEGVLGARLHPFCALIKNSLPFRRTVEEVGLSIASVFAVKSGLCWDTLGLMTAIMKTHGLGYRLSSAMVFHFFGVSYDNWAIEKKRATCNAFLRELKEIDSVNSHLAEK